MLKLPKLILIHGMNNAPEAFAPLQMELIQLGFEVHPLSLPAHAQEREENQNVQRAMDVFDRQMSPHSKSPYVAVAFSQGALYLQLWIALHPERAPLAQVLLAPALCIKRINLLEHLARVIPAKWRVPSQTPKSLRRFDQLYLWEYRTLFEKARKFQENPQLLAPTLILVDEKDELISCKMLCQEFGNKVEVLHRPYLRGRRPGKYHILFHPAYFTPTDWTKLIQKIVGFLVST